MKQLNDKQFNWLNLIKKTNFIGSMTTDLPDFTEGDSEDELLAAGNCWDVRLPAKTIADVLADGYYTDKQSQILNALAIYYIRHLPK